MFFFDEDDINEEYGYSSDDECPHDIIEDNHHCKLCGLIMDTLILPDDINTEDGAPIKRTKTQDICLLNSVKDLDMDDDIRNIIMEEVEKTSLIIKSGKDSVNKLLFMYGYRYLIIPGLIECTPTRWARICNRTIDTQTIKLIESYMKPGEYIKIILPDVYVREFLYDISTRHYTPKHYPVDGFYKDLSNFCRYLIVRRSIIDGYEKCPTLKIEGREGFDKYPILKRDVDHNRLQPDVIEDKISDLNENFHSDEDIIVEDKDVIFDLPQRIAATTLYCALQFDINNIEHVDIKGKISASLVGNPDKYGYPYNEQRICEYFGVSPKTLVTLSTSYGIKPIKIRSRRKVKVGSNISSRG